jgi:hypothetical protein
VRSPDSTATSRNSRNHQICCTSNERQTHTKRWAIFARGAQSGSNREDTVQRPTGGTGGFGGNGSGGGIGLGGVGVGLGFGSGFFGIGRSVRQQHEPAFLQIKRR